MTEKELGNALCNLESVAPDSRQLTHEILQRDSRRIRRLTYLTALFWMLTAASVISLCPFYIIVVAPRLQAYQAGRAQLENDWNDWAMAGNLAAGWIFACIVFLLLAAGCTIFLILFSRRATLRQINASLLEISERLKQLRQPLPSEPPATPGRA